MGTIRMAAQPPTYGASAPLEPQTGLLRFNQNPMTMTCPFCQAHITTATSSRSGGAVWLTCLGIIFFTGGACLPCAFIPFCIDDMKDQVHSCPNCGKVVGTYSKL